MNTRIARPSKPSFVRRVLQGDATTDQARDTGLAIVLLLLLFWLFQRADSFVVAATAAHVVTMVAPGVYRPLAVLWFGLSHVMGNVVSRVVLALIFFVLVTPIGAIRKLMGADSLKLRAFKAGSGSVMTHRNHTYTGKDLEQPY